MNSELVNVNFPSVYNIIIQYLCPIKNEFAQSRIKNDAYSLLTVETHISTIAIIFSFPRLSKFKEPI